MKIKPNKDLLETDNLYQIKIGDMIVEMQYSNGSKTFKDCILNILKKNTRFDNF